ncbi:MAG: winged helix-turn-helix domain-containing protein [Paludibacteraceae bacterium]|nr:winged helix-turn-helix domain-containing protein [Paludibacteraceae bacterium]MBQ6983368.1 winged helix-turn-helix domain-containing protein [Paludibacteraceae bacterium]MBR4705054.1 winged helix-turn-helix domain-containing protein [Paludibacteraceae bacterium]
MITKIGENAGLVWGALQNGALSLKALKKATKLKNDELALALGWLAREGKLTFEEAEADTIVALA